MPSLPTGPADLVGAAALDVVATADVGAMGLVLFCVLEGSRTSDVGGMLDGVGSATAEVVSAGIPPEAEIVGTIYEPSEYERIGTAVEIPMGMVA